MAVVSNLESSIVEFINSDGRDENSVKQILKFLPPTDPQHAVEMFQSHRGGCAGSTALHLAAQHGHMELFHKLVGHAKDMPSLVQLFRQRNLFKKTVSDLLAERGYDVLSVLVELPPDKKEEILKTQSRKDRIGNKNGCGPGGGTNMSMPMRRNMLNQVCQAAIQTEMHQVVTDTKKIYRKLGKLDTKDQKLIKERVEKEKKRQEISETVKRLEQKLSEKEVELDHCKQQRDEWKGKYQETQKQKEDAQQRLEEVEEQIRTKPKQPLSQNTDPGSDLSALEKKRKELEMTQQMLSRRMAKYGKELNEIQRKIKEIERDETVTSEELEEYKDKESECWLELVKLEEHQEKNNQQIAKCDEKIRKLQQVVPLEEINISKGEQVELLESELHDTIAKACDADDGSSNEEEDAPDPEQSSLQKKHASTPENISKSLPSKPECINNEEKPQQVSDNIEKAIDVLQLIKNYESEIEWIESQVQEYQTEIRKLEQRKAECQQGIENISAATGHGSAADEEATIGASVDLQQISADDKKFTEHERNIKQPVSLLRAAPARRSDRERAQQTPELAQSWSSPSEGAASMPAMHKGEGASVGLQHISGTEKKGENPEHNFKKDQRAFLQPGMIQKKKKTAPES